MSVPGTLTVSDSTTQPAVATLFKKQVLHLVTGTFLPSLIGRNWTLTNILKKLDGPVGTGIRTYRCILRAESSNQDSSTTLVIKVSYGKTNYQKLVALGELYAGILQDEKPYVPLCYGAFVAQPQPGTGIEPQEVGCFRGLRRTSHLAHRRRSHGCV